MKLQASSWPEKEREREREREKGKEIHTLSNQHV
jgi:hypothetical protein